MIDLKLFFVVVNAVIVIIFSFAFPFHLTLAVDYFETSKLSCGEVFESIIRSETIRGNEGRE